MCLCSFWPVYLSIYLYFKASTWVCVCLCFGFGFSFAFASILSSENYAHLVSRLTTPTASGRTWRMCDMITKCLPSVCLPCAYVCMCVCVCGLAHVKASFECNLWQDITNCQSEFRRRVLGRRHFN